MPEIKHTFTVGRMNKDLDERLLPNGEYRDAMNIEVSGSDGSNVGSVQNIRGNRQLKNVGITGAKCIGSIADTENEKIYWFVCGTTVDAIIEYDQVSDDIAFVCVDKNNVLNFDKNKLITGINLIDGLLFFTDDNSEPKVINIERFKGDGTTYGSINNNTHTTLLDVNELASDAYAFTEADVTVIKKGPTLPPTITMSNTKRTTTSGTAGVIETSVTGNFYDSSDNEPMEIGEQVTLTTTGPIPTLLNGDIVILNNGDDPDINGFDPDYTIRCEVTSYTPGSTSITVTINSIPEIVPQTTATWNLELEQEDPMFENKFIRFAYRYKYRDGEYSTIGPFSQVAFLPKDFEYNPKKGYNLGMSNDLRYLKISDFKPTDIPKGVKEIDVLYKDDSNNNIYTVKSFKPEDPEYVANAFEIESEIIYKTIPSNQLLRPFDSVPLKAKSQELVANRIIYGNYVHNFDMLDSNGVEISPKFEVNVSDRTGFTPAVLYKSPGKSIKSQRTYQLGVVYRDEYGRETPVFTDTSGSKTLSKNFASTYNELKVKMTHTPPAFADSFKFFIKETSNQYYNLAQDRWYDAEDDNIWLSFPSSERNKVDEETFLILKKKHDSDNFVSASAKYKVIAIENEAPTFLKTVKTSRGRADIGSTTIGLGSVAFPVENADSFIITKEDFITNSSFDDQPGGIISKSNLLLRFLSGNGASDYYKIQSMAYTETGTARYTISINSKFGSDISVVGTHSSPAPGLQVEIYQEETKNKAEFSGRFFVKINRDNFITDNVLAANEVAYKIDATASFIRRSGSCTTSSSGPWKADIIDKGWNWVFDRCVPSTHWNPDHTYGNPALWYQNISGMNKPPGVMAGKDLISFSILGTRDEYTGAKAVYNDFAQKIRVQGAKFQFRNDTHNGITGDPEVYTVVDSVVTMVTNYNGGSGNWSSNQRTIFTLKLDKPIVDFNETDYADRNENQQAVIELLEVDLGENTFSTNNPAIWETEPKEAIDVDLYYEASQAFPIAQHNQQKTLDYFNCFSFGNGVESNRIRDDFNAPTIARGVKASMVLAEQYKQERKKNGLIFSQIYNSTSGVNRTNQFIIAEPITKDLNPEYGSIQKLHTRDTDLTVCCEDKIIKVLANKDALFNADGNANVTSNQAVLGQSIPYVGEYGISKNPESFVSYGFQAYFADKARGVILRLSRNGLTEISAAGMVDYFRDKLAVCDVIIGAYDDNKNSLDFTLTNKAVRGHEDTVTYKEQVKGWTSRKSYIMENGLSLNNKYYTFKNGELFVHDSDYRNRFYGTQAANFTNSSLTLILNDAPGTIKSFKTLNYEGTKSRVIKSANANLDESLYDLEKINGWFASEITTNLQTGSVPSFIDKEDKWFNYIKGDQTNIGNLDTQEFSVQGIGRPSAAPTGDTSQTNVTITIKENADGNEG